MDILKFPFDSEEILRHSRQIRKELLADKSSRIKKRIAILGGSTTHDIAAVLELFLLDMGIEPVFYESEYNQYWHDGVFKNTMLEDFAPDFVFIHTTSRNLDFIENNASLSEKQCEDALKKQFNHFRMLWENIEKVYKCPIIQNNFELPLTRKFGNSDAADYHGMVYNINRLNIMLSDYALSHNNFYIHDINYLSACYGLDAWLEPKYWHLYKYALAIPAIPEFAYSLSNIFRSLSGKNKKALSLDLDNTLWGGIIGEDDLGGIEIGRETAVGQEYLSFQNYIKGLKDIGVILTVNSKNEYENALKGLSHPEGVLHADDFACIKANWNPKDENISAIADELGILPESIVFIDDNPAEREIVSSQIKGVVSPDFESADECMMIIDRSGFFEVTQITDDDRKRAEMYSENAKRKNFEKKFADYGEYLKSLEMKAEISDFSQIYISRITQLTNKSNQFNLTAKRYTLAEMQKIMESDKYIRLCGRLADKFGDNGIVSVAAGRMEQKELHIELWLMSCRVLKRDMEYAMLDCLIEKCRENKIAEVYGYYYKTEKNAMVSGLYEDFGFRKINSDEKGNTVWKLEVSGYRNKNKYTEINGKEHVKC